MYFVLLDTYVALHDTCGGFAQEKLLNTSVISLSLPLTQLKHDVTSKFAELGNLSNPIVFPVTLVLQIIDTSSLEIYSKRR